ncbi:MAG: PIG-L family deacetylase [bacterium]|nr:PIG-L family deacetylase [Acidimicrobiia bacterium]MCY4651474.1 PIG-L family deacetylase [bacterium]
MSRQLPTPERALTIGAHPDDAEFGAGGVLSKWSAGGCEASMLVMTDGSKGSWDPGTEPAELIETRRAEQLRSASALGITGEVVMLGEVDGELEYSMQLRETLCWWIRKLRPNVVLTHDPWMRYLLHPDHRVTGMAASDGVVAARDHLFYPDQLSEGITKHRPDAILYWASDRPDHREDITGYVEQKVAALLCHSSQTETTMDGADVSADRRDRFAEKIARRAAEAGSPAGLESAEAFKIVRP